MKERIVIFMPAYNAESTLEDIWKKIPPSLKKYTFLIDDASQDKTFFLAKRLGIPSSQNVKNLGYGGNVKVCLQKALARGADTMIELHPDNEYDPSVIPTALRKIKSTTGLVLGKRIQPHKHGMYLWKYIPSKILSYIDGIILGVRISDLHQGFRVYTRQFLEQSNFLKNSQGYLFSFEIIAQAIYSGFTIAEVPVKAVYTGGKRGAPLWASIRYAGETFRILFLFLIAKGGIKVSLFSK